MSDGAILLLVTVVYFAIVTAIGWAAYRRARSGPGGAEDYFLAGRGAKTLVLFMALFGTNVTPFVLMGIPGRAYHDGVGVFGYNAAIVALGIPLSFYLIGYPAWKAARRIGAITPAELYAEQLGSRAVGWVLFGAFAFYTLPYLVTSVLGAGLAVSTLSDGAVGLPAAAAGLLVITIAYTTAGGMRATMWTNVFQGLVFLGFTVLAFVLVARALGGFCAATEAVRRLEPSLLVKAGHPGFAPRPWGSWALAISLTVIAFPHMLVRVFAAKDVTALKNSCRLYPVALVLLWVPAVMLGVWGAAAVPGLQGSQSDRIFVLLIDAHLGPWLRGVGLAGILAAVMSTIDAQFLTLSSMLTRDVLRRVWPELPERREVTYGRVFILALAVLTYLVVLWRPASIFSIAAFSFSGYVMLIPTLYLALAWPRMSARGAIASIVAGNVVLLATFAAEAPPLQVHPVAWGLGAAIVGALVFPRPAPGR